MTDESINTMIAALRRIARTVGDHPLHWTRRNDVHGLDGIPADESCRCPSCEAKNALAEIARIEHQAT